MRMGGLCPRSMKAGKRFNKIRANGYKTCVKGNKLGGFIKDIHQSEERDPICSFAANAPRFKALLTHCAGD